MTTRTLADGNEIPLLGLGVWQVPKGPECEQAVRWALELGYRHIDTAQAYGNEESVGRALRDSGVPRDEVFITTKFYPAREDPEAEAQRSLERLGIDYVDLYIIHWPQGGPTWAWPGMERARARGYARSIGVSNFSVARARRAARDRRGPRRSSTRCSSARSSTGARCSTRATSAASRSRPTARSAPAATSPTSASARSPSASGARRRRSCCAGACSASSSSSRSRRTASGSRRTPRSSTSTLSDEDMAALDALDETGGTDRSNEDAPGGEPRTRAGRSPRRSCRCPARAAPLVALPAARRGSERLLHGVRADRRDRAVGPNR